MDKIVNDLYDYISSNMQSDFVPIGTEISFIISIFILRLVTFSLTINRRRLIHSYSIEPMNACSNKSSQMLTKEVNNKGFSSSVHCGLCMLFVCTFSFILFWRMFNTAEMQKWQQQQQQKRGAEPERVANTTHYDH